MLQLVLQQLHSHLGKGDTESRQAGFEASGGLQLIQQLGTQGQTRLAQLVQGINSRYPEQVRLKAALGATECLQHCIPPAWGEC